MVVSFELHLKGPIWKTPLLAYQEAHAIRFTSLVPYCLFMSSKPAQSVVYKPLKSPLVPWLSHDSQLVGPGRLGSAVPLIAGSVAEFVAIGGCEIIENGRTA